MAGRKVRPVAGILVLWGLVSGVLVAGRKARPVAGILVVRPTSVRIAFAGSLVLAARTGLAIQVRYDTIRYDTKCYFNVRSKADMSQLNLPHGNNN